MDEPDQSTDAETPWLRHPPPAPVAPDPGPFPRDLPLTRRRVASLVLVSAVVSAAVSGAIVAATRDSGTPSRPAGAFAPNTSRLAKPQDVQGVLQRVQPAVVTIRTQAFSPGTFFPTGGAGTGMLLTADGEVLTNAHVVEGATSIKVTVYGEKESRDADLVGSDPQADIALVKIRGASGLPTVKLGNSKSLQVGDDVIAIGNALALAGGPTVTEGIVSAKDRAIEGDEALSGLIQTDAAINPGNSGGPLVDAAGEVVGMNTAVSADAQNIGFAIAVDTIKPSVERLRTGKGAVTARAFLGVTAVTLTPEIRQQYGFSPDHGAIVDAVTPGSPAENAGLRRADVVVELGGKRVETADELVAIVREHKPGDRLDVRFFRGDADRTLAVTLGSRPAANR